jgi:hypothetical protein
MECRPTLLQRIGASLLWSAGAAIVVCASVLAYQTDAPYRLLLLGLGLGWVMLALAIPFIGPLVLSAHPTIILSDRGIDDRRFRIGLIPWEDINSVSAYSVSSRPYVQLWLRNEREYLTRWPLWRRSLGRLATAMGYSPFSISFSFLTPGYQPVYDYLGRHAQIRDDS